MSFMRIAGRLVTSVLFLATAGFAGGPTSGSLDENQYPAIVAPVAEFGEYGNVPGAGGFLASFGAPGSAAGQFNRPGGLDLDDSGNLYVVDPGNARVQVFDSGLRYRREWGSLGTGDGEFRLPLEIAVVDGGAGRAYVLDAQSIAGETAGERGRERLPDECGDPRRSSQSYEGYEGTVVEVGDGDTLVVDIHIREIELDGVTYSSPRRGKTTVQLVCLDAPPVTEAIGMESKERLSARLLGKGVAVGISPYQEEGTPLNVMIFLQGGHPIDENVEQLEQGLARFRYFGRHALDFWERCHYERAQKRAQKTRIGVWAN